MNLLDNNIEEILSRNNSDKFIRIASKSVRSPEILEYILSSDRSIQGIMAYSASEALFLANRGFDNILIAYPIVDRTYIKEVLQEVSNGKNIYLMVDSNDHLEIINEEAEKLEVIAPLCLDIDLSHKFGVIYFGVYRSPLNGIEKFRQFVNKVQDYDNITIKGLMGYEAQIAGVADNSPARNFLLNFIVRRLKGRSIKKLQNYREQSVTYLKDRGFDLDFVNGGGTGSVESTIKEDVVTEVTVGSGFYSPTLFDYYNNFHHQPACAYAIQVCRIPKPGIYTCHGGGYIASGSIGIDKQPQPYLPENTSLFPDEGAGEVQTPVKTSHPLNIGDPVFFRHAKAGELCEHFNTLYLIRDGEIIDEVPTYRGEGMNFL